MKLVLYGINFWPEVTGCGKYSAEMAAWLADSGHQVEVVTAPPYYPEWQISPGYSAWRGMREHMPTGNGSVSVRRSALWVPRRVTGLTRITHLASFALCSLLPLISAMRKRPDILFVVVPTLASLPAALLFGRFFGAKVWVHVQDFEVDAAFGLGVVKGGTAQKFALAIEAALLQAADRVSSISPKMLMRLREKGIQKTKAVLLPNWVDLTTIFPLNGDNAFRSELNLAPDQLLCLYAGNMGEKQGLDLLIEAAKAMESMPVVHFVFAGAGAARDRLQAQAAGMDNVTWLPLQPLSRLNLMLNAADVHLLPQRADAADLVMPSKLTGILASGRAVIGTAQADTQLGEVLDAVGMRVAPGDVAALTSGLLTLLQNPALRVELGRKGRAYAEEHLALDRIMARFVDEAVLSCRVEASPPEAPHVG